MTAYTAIHFANLYINAYCIANAIVDYAGEIVQVNYMFSLAPNNPLLQLCYDLLPYEYWYMYLVVPIVVVYLGAIYGANALYRRRKKVKE